MVRYAGKEGGNSSTMTYQVERDVVRYLLTSTYSGSGGGSSSGSSSHANTASSSSKSSNMHLKRATNYIACSSSNGILLQIFTSAEDAARYNKGIC